MQGHTHFCVTTSAAWQGGEVRLQMSRQDSKNARSPLGRPVGTTARVRLGDSSSNACKHTCVALVLCCGCRPLVCAANSCQGDVVWHLVGLHGLLSPVWCGDFFDFVVSLFDWGERCVKMWLADMWKKK